jgi:hypothetical protein
MVIVPPYCGEPRLFHQFPVDVVVVTTVVGVVVAFDVFDLVQDGKTNDNAIRQLSKTQITPFFTLTSFVI